MLLNPVAIRPLRNFLPGYEIDEIMSAIIGLRVLIMDASMAVVSVIANRNDSCVINRPRKEA